MLRAFSAFALLCCVACGEEGISGLPANPTVEQALEQAGVDVDALFAAPTAAEREAVWAEWNARTVDADDPRIEASFHVEGGRTLRVISHAHLGGRQYGALLLPDGEHAPRTLPLQLSLIGLGPGLELKLEEPKAPPDDAPTTVIALPSFRGHTVRFRDQTWVSDGDAWKFCDGGTDDTLAFIEAVRQLEPAVDTSRILAIGGSRGGTVALLLAARDPRVLGAISFAGGTDYFARDLLTHGNAYVLYEKRLLRRLLDGEEDASEARLRLLRCSPRHFAEHLPKLQLHHGDADWALPVDQLHRLVQALDALPAGSVDYDVFEYEGIGHDFEGALDRLTTRIGAFVRALL